MKEKVFFFPEGRRKSIETLSNKTEHNYEFFKSCKIAQRL